MFKSCFEVVSVFKVSKEINEVLFRCTEWFSKDKTIEKIEFVRFYKDELSRMITVKTNKEFTVGQKFSGDEFYALSRFFYNYGYGSIVYGTA